MIFLHANADVGAEFGEHAFELGGIEGVIDGDLSDGAEEEVTGLGGGIAFGAEFFEVAADLGDDGGDFADGAGVVVSVHIKAEVFDHAVRNVGFFDDLQVQSFEFVEGGDELVVALC